MADRTPSAAELPADVWIRLGTETEKEFEEALAKLAKELGVSPDEVVEMTVAAAYREAIG